jgi:hypothetical protein
VKRGAGLRQRMAEAEADLKRLRNLRRKVNRARRFPMNTCGASRHLHMIADQLASGKVTAMLVGEPQHCAESMYAVLHALWTLRTKAGKRGAGLGV